MLMPSIFGENLFDEWMEFPMRSLADVDRKLYGKRRPNIMKTDIRETENGYEMDIDLPGFKKDEVTAKLEKGYLTVSAAKALDENEKDEKSGKYIRRERCSGSVSRSYYVGDHLTQDDIHAKFEDGTLRLEVPKVSQAAVEEQKFIAIEG